ncbi:hypothetical protein KKB44_00740 [Candidatus Micrarchaeota archaeon]|nr:hypothetical protein [Candidatus Micrarchaeota archaeon]
MLSREEISEFKKVHYKLKTGGKQNSTVVELSALLKDLIENIESTSEREKTLWNPDISTKIKLAKKGARLYKKLEYFEIDVVKEFENGNVTEDIGKKFMLVTKLIKNNKLDLAKKEFVYFEKILKLNKEYEQSMEEMEKKDKMLKKERHRMENLLAEISGLEKIRIDSEKVQQYENLLSSLEKLEKIRMQYISSFTSQPIIELVKNSDPISEYLPLPKKEELDEIKQFFVGYPDIGKYEPDKICELFDFSEKKLSHICPETSRFKKIILSNRKYFETLRDLERSNFLALDDEKALSFYAKIADAQEIVGQIKSVRKDQSCKEEYEKKKQFEEKKKELLKYSKNDLEKELEEINSLLEFLHSVPEEKEEGFLSKLSSLLKI